MKFTDYFTAHLKAFLCSFGIFALVLMGIVLVSPQESDEPSNLPETVQIAVIEDLKAKYVGNYDGDTLTVEILGWPEPIKFWPVRIYGIDCPEIKGKTKYERDEAKVSKRFVELKCKKSEHLLLKNVQKDKYFRLLAEVYIDGKDNLGKMMLEKGYAKEYHGSGPKPNWE